MQLYYVTQKLRGRAETAENFGLLSIRPMVKKNAGKGVVQTKKNLSLSQCKANISS